jgi:hypothetical protein
MDWHRLFGLILTDFFADSPFVVEPEKDALLQLFSASAETVGHYQQRSHDASSLVGRLLGNLASL